MLARLVILAGAAMAGYVDVVVGASLMFVWTIVYQLVTGGDSGTPPIINVVAGALIGPVPDFDITWKLLTNRWSDRLEDGDHRDTLFHRPLIMMSIAAAIAYLFGGTFWAVGVALCLLGHFVHDTKWVNEASDIHFFWPFTNKGPIPYMTTVGWIEKYWIKPTHMSMPELGFAIAAASALLFIYADSTVALAFWFVQVLVIVAVWQIARELRLA